MSRQGCHDLSDDRRLSRRAAKGAHETVKTFSYISRYFTTLARPMIVSSTPIYCNA